MPNDVANLLAPIAVLTLITAKYPDPEPIRRGCKLIMSRQLPDGSWAQEGIEGGESVAAALTNLLLIASSPSVFNKNAAISCELSRRSPRLNLELTSSAALQTPTTCVGRVQLY